MNFEIGSVGSVGSWCWLV